MNIVRQSIWCSVRKALRNIALAAFLPVAVIMGSLALPCDAGMNQFKPDLMNPYLEREFDWSMYMDVREVKHYLNYTGSQLHPLSKVGVNFRSHPRNNIALESSAAKVYEELWFYSEHPVGLRRKCKLESTGEETGVIIVGEFQDKPAYAEAITNSLVRLVLDVQLNNMVPSVILLPRDQYDKVAAYLGRYKFSPYLSAMQGRQFNIHLRSYPHGPGSKDEYYYYQKSY